MTLSSVPRNGKNSGSVMLARSIAIVAVVFVVEIIADRFLPRILPFDDLTVQVLAHSFSIIIFSAPFIWWLVYLPMQTLALSGKEQFEHLFQQMVDAIIITDKDGTVSSCNPAAERIFCAVAEKIIGTSIGTLIIAPANMLLQERHEVGSPHIAESLLFQDCFAVRQDNVRIPVSISASKAAFNGTDAWIIIVRDLSMIKAVERQLQQSNALLQATVQSTADGILAVDWGRTVQVCNERFVEMMGIPREIIRDRDNLKMVAMVAELMADPVSYQKRVEELYQDQSGTSHDILQLKNGRVIERYSQPQVVNGISMGRVWSFREVTDKIRSEQELLRSEERFRNLATNAPVGIFETDCEGNCLYVNPAWCVIAGMSAEQAVGRGWSVALHPEDGPRIEREWYASVREKRPFKLEYRFGTPEGQERWVLGSASSIKNADGAVSGYIGIVLDITDRKQAELSLIESEDRFRKIFEESEDAIVLFAFGSCTVLDVNPVTEKLYGYTRLELIGLCFNVFRNKDDYHDFVHAVCLLKGQQTSQLDHMVNLRSDGSEVHVSVRAKVIKLQGQDVIYCTLRDITVRLRMEDEARSIQSKLIEANKMTSLGLLVAGIAHEINNPNNYIMTNAQMLYQIWEDLDPLLRDEAERRGDFTLGGLPYSQLEEALPEMIGAISEGARRIKEIIGELKNYSRRSGDPMGLLDINQVVHSSMLLLKHHINNCTENFLIELEEGLPLVSGNAQQLEQVIVNLVMNALQALDSKDQRVCLSSFHSKENRTVSLSVADNGCGMSDEVKARIMEPFFTTRLDAGGTGLGLSISRSIILAHHGSVEVESKAGQGTTVTVSFPVADNRHAGSSN